MISQRCSEEVSVLKVWRFAINKSFIMDNLILQYLHLQREMSSQ